LLILWAVFFAGCWNMYGDVENDIGQADVYAGGYSINSSGVGVPGYWKNGAWTSLPTLDPTKISIVYSLVVVTY